MEEEEEEKEFDPQQPMDEDNNEEEEGVLNPSHIDFAGNILLTCRCTFNKSFLGIKRSLGVSAREGFESRVFSLILMLKYIYVLYREKKTGG